MVYFCIFFRFVCSDVTEYLLGYTISVAAYVPSNVIDVDLSQSQDRCAAENDNDEKNDQAVYPIDKFGNLASDNASTKYVFSTNINLISSSSTLANNKYTLVISEFGYDNDILSLNNMNNYPVDHKTQLILEKYKNTTATPFQTIKFELCHYSANYSIWFNKQTHNIGLLHRTLPIIL